MKQNVERLVWSLVFIVLLAFLTVQLLGLALSWPLLPEDWAFLLGLLIFWLLANKLLFGYGLYISLTEGFLADAELDEAGLRNRIRQPEEWLRPLALASLLVAWLNELDKYRYTYYATYLVVALLAILTKFDLLGYDLIGNYLEGAFWGATVVTFFVFALDLIAHTYPGDILAHASSALESPLPLPDSP